jgi:hypothetical protein
LNLNHKKESKKAIVKNPVEWVFSSSFIEAVGLDVEGKDDSSPWDKKSTSNLLVSLQIISLFQEITNIIRRKFTMKHIRRQVEWTRLMTLLSRWFIRIKKLKRLLIYTAFPSYNTR